MYMDRRLLIFPLAGVVWAQQTAPDAEEAKQALVARVKQYYQLLLEKKFRQAEGLVAEESKDDYYNRQKPEIKGFEVMTAELNPDKTTAKVMVKAMTLTLMPGVGAQVFDMRVPTYWKLENDKWCWYIPEELKNATPFGTMKIGEVEEAAATAGKKIMEGEGRAPALGVLVNQVTIDKTSILFTRKDPDQTVVITNGLPGPLTLRVDPHAEQIGGLKVTMAKTSLESGEKGTITLHWDGTKTFRDVVEIATFPVNRAFDIAVEAK